MFNIASRAKLPTKKHRSFENQATMITFVWHYHHRQWPHPSVAAREENFALRVNFRYTENDDHREKRVANEAVQLPAKWNSPRAAWPEWIRWCCHSTLLHWSPKWREMPLTRSARWTLLSSLPEITSINPASMKVRSINAMWLSSKFGLQTKDESDERIKECRLEERKTQEIFSQSNSSLVSSIHWCTDLVDERRDSFAAPSLATNV